MFADFTVGIIMINNIKMWLRRHGASVSEIPVYISNIRDLFYQQTENDYELQLTQLKQNWSQPFVFYYMNEKVIVYLTEKCFQFYFCR